MTKDYDIQELIYRLSYEIKDKNHMFALVVIMNMVKRLYSEVVFRTTMELG